MIAAAIVLVCVTGAILLTVAHQYFAAAFVAVAGVAVPAHLLRAPGSAPAPVGVLASCAGLMLGGIWILVPPEGEHPPVVMVVVAWLVIAMSLAGIAAVAFVTVKGTPARRNDASPRRSTSE